MPEQNIEQIIAYKNEEHDFVNIKASVRLDNTGMPCILFSADNDSLSNSEGDLLLRFIQSLNSGQFKINGNVALQHKFNPDSETAKQLGEIGNARMLITFSLSENK